MKHIIILGDGMADHAVERLGGKTLLQYADKPMMDLLAKNGRTGRLITVPEGFPPGSEVANTAILGYDLNKVYEGRGPLEAASIGYDMQPDDFAIRCNLITLEDGKIITHNGGNLQTEDARVLIDYLNEHLAKPINEREGCERVKFICGIQYRHLLVIKGGSKHIVCNPPHDHPGEEWKSLTPNPSPIGEGSDYTQEANLSTPLSNGTGTGDYTQEANLYTPLSNGTGTGDYTQEASLYTPLSNGTGTGDYTQEASLYTPLSNGTGTGDYTQEANLSTPLSNGTGTGDYTQEANLSTPLSNRRGVGGEALSPQRTSDLINDLILKSQELLARHPYNLAKAARGERQANSIWPWSGGYRPSMQTLMQQYPQIKTGAVISAVDLIQGIGRYAGLRIIKVPGATGLADTNYEGKAEAAIEALKKDDFVFVHVEATDEAGHDGDLDLKLRAINYLDQRLIRPIVEATEQMSEPVCIAVLPDHPTPVELRIHVNEPVPFLIYYKGIEPDSVQHYDELSCVSGGYGLLRLNEFMKEFMKIS